VVPYISSLIIDSEDNVENKSNLYTQVFRLPALKYCNLSFKEISRLELLPVAMKEFSPIEHLIINNTYPLNDLNNLLSYVPHLKRLSIHSEYKYRIEQMQLYSSTLIHLTHVFLNGPDIPFDQFESIVQSFLEIIIKYTCIIEKSYLHVVSLVVVGVVETETMQSLSQKEFLEIYQ
jgi:hypothetical protein